MKEYIVGLENEHSHALDVCYKEELIRCKDCKWFGKSGCAVLIVDESDKPKEDNFCSWAEPVRHGKWIKEPNCYYRCSECGAHYPSIKGYMDYNYCPTCGARMDAERREE